MSYVSDKFSEETRTPSQPIQLLSLLRPDLEFFWSINPTTRYTGNHYDHLETLSSWSQRQPRRLLWERSSSHFIPGVSHTYVNYSKYIENASHIPKGGIWGPTRIPGVEPIGPEPPFAAATDDIAYSWGVDEPADLITTGPIIDATKEFDIKVKNYPLPTSPKARTRPTPARKLTAPFLTRYSKRLLRAMHHGQVALGAAMPLDQYSVSTALHHGLKAVSVPSPVFLDYAKTAEMVEHEYNFQATGDGEKGTDDPLAKYNEIRKRMSVWGPASSGNAGVGDKSSWANSDDTTLEGVFSDEIYKRWLGYVRIRAAIE